MGLVNLPVGARISNAMLAYGEYLKKTFWPTDLSFFYPLTTTMPGPGGKLAAAVFILLLVTIIAIIFLKKTPSLFVGWFWFLGTLAPVIGIIQVGNQAMADRYAYIPLIGLGISFAWLVADFAGKNRWNKAIALSGLAVVLVLLALQTRKQTGYWKSDETLADHAILVTRDNYLAYSMKGHCLLQRNDFKGAKQCHQKALALFPRLDVSRLNLAYINLVQGNNRDAIAVLKEVLARDSLHTLANHLCGLAYAGLDDYVRAEACFARALKKDPAYGPASQAMRLINERKKGMDPATNYFHALPGPAPAARR
jgi:Tfp pilus assembly protein PilF